MDIVAVNFEGEFRIDSRLMAGRLNKTHKIVVAQISEYEQQFQALGILPAQTEEIKGRGQPAKYFMLNEDQCYFLLTLTRNSAHVTALKLALVQGFRVARDSLTPFTLPAPTPDFSALERLAGLTVQALTVVKAEIQQQVAADIQTAKDEVRAEVAGEMAEKIGSLGATSEQRHEVKTLVRAIVVARTRMNLGNSSWPAVYNECWNACRVGSLDVMTRAQYPQVEAYLRAELVALGAMSDTGLFSEKHAGVA